MVYETIALPLSYVGTKPEGSSGGSVPWRLPVVMVVSLVHVLKLELFVGHVHVGEPWMMVLVLVGGREVGPLIPFTRLAVMGNVRVPVYMGQLQVLVVREFLGPTLLSLRLIAGFGSAGMAHLVEGALYAVGFLHCACLRTLVGCDAASPPHPGPATR
jgi:hypothetical protein